MSVWLQRAETEGSQETEITAMSQNERSFEQVPSFKERKMGSEYQLLSSTVSCSSLFKGMYSFCKSCQHFWGSELKVVFIFVESGRICCDRSELCQLEQNAMHHFTNNVHVMEEQHSFGISEAQLFIG